MERCIRIYTDNATLEITRDVNTNLTVLQQPVADCLARLELNLEAESLRPEDDYERGFIRIRVAGTVNLEKLHSCDGLIVLSIRRDLHPGPIDHSGDREEDRMPKAPPSAQQAIMPHPPEPLTQTPTQPTPGPNAP